MSTFNDREKANETKFVHDEEVKFKITSRTRKLLGLWAAEKMGLKNEEALNYAKDLISYGIENTTPGAVIKKIIKDTEAKGLKLSEIEVKTKKSELEVIAEKQVLEKSK